MGTIPPHTRLVLITKIPAPHAGIQYFLRTLMSTSSYSIGPVTDYENIARSGPASHHAVRDPPGQ